MLEQDATAVCGERHERVRTPGDAGGGPKARSAFTVARSRSSAHGFAGSTGAERVLPSWENAVSEDWLGKWAMNQNADQRLDAAFQAFGPVARGRRSGFRRSGAVEARRPPARFAGVVGRARMKAWMETGLTTWIIAGDPDRRHSHGMRDMLLVAAIGVDAKGDKHPLGLVEGATENATTVQALDRQSRRAWTRSNRATPVHHRWREGAGLRRSAAPLRRRYGDPALPDSTRSAQHSGSAA